MTFSNVSRKSHEFFNRSKVEIRQFVGNPRSYVTHNRGAMISLATKISVIAAYCALMVTFPIYTISFTATFAATYLKLIIPEQVSKITNFVQNFVSKGSWHLATAVAFSLCFLAVTPLSLTMFGGGVIMGASLGLIYLNRNNDQAASREIPETDMSNSPEIVNK